RHAGALTLPSSPTRRSSDLLGGANLELRRLPARFLPPDALHSTVDALGLRAAVAIPRGAYVTASALAGRGHRPWSGARPGAGSVDRKSTRLNSSHRTISYAV